MHADGVVVQACGLVFREVWLEQRDEEARRGRGLEVQRHVRAAELPRSQRSLPHGVTYVWSSDVSGENTSERTALSKSN